MDSKVETNRASKLNSFFMFGTFAWLTARCRSGLMLRAVSCRGSKHFEDQGKTLAATPTGDQTES